MCQRILKQIEGPVTKGLILQNSNLDEPFLSVKPQHRHILQILKLCGAAEKFY